MAKKKAEALQRSKIPMRDSLPERTKNLRKKISVFEYDKTGSFVRAAEPSINRVQPIAHTHTIRDDIKGLFLISLSIFILTTNVLPASTGVLGKTIVQNMLYPAVGKGMMLLPLFIALWGVSILLRQQSSRSLVRKIGAVVGFLTFITIAEIFNSGQLIEFKLPTAYHGGGIVGYSLSFIFQQIFGPTGTFVLLLTFAAVSFLLLFNIPLYLLRKKMKNFAEIQPKNLRAPALITNQKQYAGKHRAEAQPASPGQRKKMFDVLKDMFSFAEESPKKKVQNAPEVRPMVRTRQQQMATPPKMQSAKRIPHSMKTQSDENYSNYKLPPLTLLQDGAVPASHHQKLVKQSQEDTRVLEATFANFKLEAKVVNVSFGPSITRYELQPGPGVRVNRISNLADDIALNLAVAGVRIEAPVPGKSVVGIEVPNTIVRNVSLAQLVKTEEFQSDPSRLKIALGQDIGGYPVYGDIGKMPHMLIAGATGSGKSVCLNTLIMSILLRARPDEVKFLMIDPKRIELILYNNIPHLVAPVINEPDMAAAVLKNWALKEMQRRYDKFSRVGAKNLAVFNEYIDKNGSRGKIVTVNPKTGQEELLEKLPYVILVIDELADLMMVASRDVEMTICRLAQMARATGMHLVIATQRPSVDVITGLIKANVPSRISFAVQSQIDSRTVLDRMGAEKLLGRGDMLYAPVGAHKMQRVQGVYVTDKEISAVVRAVKAQGKPHYMQEILEIKPEQDNSLAIDTIDGKDAYFEQAAKIVQATGKTSISYLQRKLRIGYNRAARIMEELEESGIVKPKDIPQPQI